MYSKGEKKSCIHHLKLVVTSKEKLVATEWKWGHSLSASGVSNGERIPFCSLNSRHRQVGNWGARFLTVLSVRNLRCCHILVGCYERVPRVLGSARSVVQDGNSGKTALTPAQQNMRQLKRRLFREGDSGSLTFQGRLWTGFREVMMENEYTKKHAIEFCHGQLASPGSLIDVQGGRRWMIRPWMIICGNTAKAFVSAELLRQAAK